MESQCLGCSRGEQLVMSFQTNARLDKLERKMNWLVECEKVRRHNEQAKKDEAEGYKVDYKKPPLTPLF